MTTDQFLMLIGCGCLILGGVLAIRFIRQARKRPAGLQMQEDEPGDCRG